MNVPRERSTFPANICLDDVSAAAVEAVESPPKKMPEGSLELLVHQPIYNRVKN